jgi:hypothetical protein
MCDFNSKSKSANLRLQVPIWGLDGSYTSYESRKLDLQCAKLNKQQHLHNSFAFKSAHGKSFLATISKISFKGVFYSIL